ncbi:hypothetical protein ACFYMR_06645 [Streptomyces albogriseolus]|uniref:hypothetical protein n=1 Tax=Streptomyces albogriseolus TaxID=1887 RepID=UPI00225B1306|nr:hypothetical protein [Streptomyces viridodiastaticus]MCX4570327.1 hypothetical protein [Streptomyces viridodiastaticus]
MTFHQPPPPPDHRPQGAGPFGLGTPTGPGQPTRDRRRWLTYGAVALVFLLIGVGIGTSSGSADTGEATAARTKAGPRPTATVTETAEAEPAPTVTETETVTAKPAKTEKPGPATSFSGEGEYLVGEDIKAGIYKTAGAEDEFGCYWERAKDASGEFDSIIANNNLNGPGRVTLNNGEYFKTNRCQEWKRVG